MSRESQKSGLSIQLHIHKRSGYNQTQNRGVSKAIWPAHKRRRVATGKVAQSRREMIGIITQWAHACQIVYRHYCQILNKQVTIAHATQWSMAVLAITVIMTMSLLYDWSLLLIFMALCMMIMIITMQILLKNAHTIDTNTVTNAVQHTVTDVQDFAQTPLPDSLPDLQTEQASEYPTISFPNTPMPATPLIRILETIDLSSTNVEHFLDSLKQTPPKTEIEWSTQQDEPQASEQTKY